MAIRCRSGFRAWTKRSAWDAIYAGWCARWKAALRWSKSIRVSRINPGKKEWAGRARPPHRPTRELAADRGVRPTMANTLIRNGTVVTARETTAADVLIEGERIREVRPG